MLKLEGAERLILQVILNFQGDSGNYVVDVRISEETDLPLDDVRNWLLTLQDKEFVSVVRGETGLSTFIEAKGVLALKQSLPLTLKRIEDVQEQLGTVRVPSTDPHAANSNGTGLQPTTTEPERATERSDYGDQTEPISGVMPTGSTSSEGSQSGKKPTRRLATCFAGLCLGSILTIFALAILSEYQQRGSPRRVVRHLLGAQNVPSQFGRSDTASQYTKKDDSPDPGTGATSAASVASELATTTNQALAADGSQVEVSVWNENVKTFLTALNHQVTSGISVDQLKQFYDGNVVSWKIGVGRREGPKRSKEAFEFYDLPLAPIYLAGERALEGPAHLVIRRVTLRNAPTNPTEGPLNPDEAAVHAALQQGIAEIRARSEPAVYPGDGYEVPYNVPIFVKGCLAVRDSTTVELIVVEWSYIKT